MIRILIIDDEKGICDFLSILLTKEGYKTKATQSPKEFLSIVENWKPQIVLVDLRFPQANGLTILTDIKEKFPATIVILITAYASLESAIEAMRRGAFDYIIKPFKIEEIRIVLKRAIETQQLRAENVELKHKLETKKTTEYLIGASKVFQNMVELIHKVAITDSSILICGESGTGKELVAREIYKLSNRKDKPFIPINCGALPETLLESELFGHTKGSFTGAIKDKPGLFKSADNGTLFLDEIASASPKIQVDLLRVLEQKEFTPIGAVTPVNVDVRLITATNKNLEQLAVEGKFRDDLFYRINVIQILVPSLRERKEDLPLLVNYFLKKYCAKHNLQTKKISLKAMNMLMKYLWPGNIRELENTIERAIILETSNTISTEALPDKIKESQLSGQFTGFTKVEANIKSENNEIPTAIDNKNGFAKKQTIPNIAKRQEEILIYVRNNGEITSKICASIFKISQRMARNDLQALVNKGFIVRKGDSDKTAYYALAEI